jgi:asparagine synthase (glutamine-hydrolysing)
MGAMLRHRGPDDEGIFVSGRAGLAHRRLSIVDRQGGHQPLSNEDGSVWIAFNGEIYNHADIRRRLLARGHVFRTTSDTEAIVHAWEDEGPDCVLRLRGMFAFAIWDERSGTAFLARDRLGEKPLYWALTTGGDLVFASEAKALLIVSDVDPTSDPDAIDAYLTLRYVPAPLTPWRAIRKLPPGSSLLFHRGVARVVTYWELPTEGLDQSRPMEAIAASDLRDRIDQSVAARLMGEVPVGTFLSGGIDSTDVTASMVLARHGAPVSTFAVGYRSEGAAHADDDLGFAQLAAEELGTLHSALTIDPLAVARELPRIVWHLDEPLADDACIPLYFLARRAKSDVTVILSGEGGDEILAGYGAYRRHTLIERWRGRASWPFSALGRMVALAPSPALAQVGAALAGPLDRSYQGVPRVLAPRTRRLLGLPDQGTAARVLAPLWEATRGLDPLRRMLYVDTKLWLPDDLLAKADRMTMASALELRVPLLDHELVEFAWRLPAHLKLRGKVGKYLLRRAARGRVPPAILQRPKRGFPVPMAAWLRGPLKSLAADALFSLPDLGSSGRRAALRLFEQHQRGLDHVSTLYPLLVLSLWRQALQGQLRPEEVGRQPRDVEAK